MHFVIRIESPHTVKTGAGFNYTTKMGICLYGFFELSIAMCHYDEVITNQRGVSCCCQN